MPSPIPSLPLLHSLRRSLNPPRSLLSLSHHTPTYRLSFHSPFPPSSSTVPSATRPSSTASPSSKPSSSSDRGPVSSETTQTDFFAMDVLSNTAPPTSAIDACLSNGFHFDNGLKISDGSGAMLVGGEVFAWRPWEILPGGRREGMVDERGVWGRGLGGEGEGKGQGGGCWGVLEVGWPKPDMLILGLGASIYPIAPEVRRYINSLGITIDVQDTRNAAAQFNLLATERGVSSIAAALIPIGWRGKM